MLTITICYYINDLPKCLMHSEISIYADDTVVYYSGSHINAIRENLQEDVKRVEQWLTSNRLILNQSKRKGYSSEQGNYCKPLQTLHCRFKERTLREWQSLIISGLYSTNNFTGKSILTLFVTKPTSD